MSKKKWLFVLFLLLLVALTKIAVERFISQDLREKIENTTLVGNAPTAPHFGANNGIVEWVEKVAENENCGLGIIDSNGLMSYGDMCFQEATFRHYVSRYELLPQCEYDEVMNWITDGKMGREVAYRMIEEDTGNWTHWTNTTKKVGKPNIN